MKRGLWHQCGNRSQTIAMEQLKLGIGSGVILSPRDLSFKNAKQRASAMRKLGAEVTVDPQFYLPTSTVGTVKDWGLIVHRMSAAKLAKLSMQDVKALTKVIKQINEACACTAVVSPAIVYDAGQQTVVEANRKLYEAAREAGDALGIPTYCSVPVGHSVAQSNDEVIELLSRVTAFQPGGWLLAWEFNSGRVPSGAPRVRAFAKACLALAITGLPVLHSCAGPLALLSHAFGCTAAGICHSQNMWKLDRSRFVASMSGGGGGAPPRYFSKALWGTIVFPDEYAALSPTLRKIVHTSSPFSKGVGINPPFARSQLPKWDAYKHLIYVIGTMVQELGAAESARRAAEVAKQVLEVSVATHAQIEAFMGVALKDETAQYQPTWLDALDGTLKHNKSDYDYLDLMGGGSDES